ncbi:MAG: aspartate kinase [Holophaga sp.]|nr:aspartate kinase [Holophaga sp.]
MRSEQPQEPPQPDLGADGLPEQAGIIVMKFGGSSVADAERMTEVAALVAQAPGTPLVVLSATARTTDTLFGAARQAERGDLGAALDLQRNLLGRHRGIAQELFPAGLPAALDQALAGLGDELDLLLRGVAMLRELSARSMDAIASIGERLSTRILAAHLGAAWVDARSVLRTDDGFGGARPQPGAIAALAARHLAPQLAPGRPVVTQGYIGATAEGLTTTLGRGGSDYSAALFGAALGATDIQIWTDVEGVLTCDPRVVPQARPIARLSFKEAAELAAFGAKVLHPATIQPAMAAGIPVTVRSTRQPRGHFTTITAEAHTGRAITPLAQRGPVSVLTISTGELACQDGFQAMADLFQVFSRHHVSVDLVATAEASVSLAVDPGAPLEALLRDLEGLGTAVAVARDRTIVAVVGEQLRFTPGVTGRCFAALKAINVELISMGANEINLSFVVRQEDAGGALRALHTALIESPARRRDGLAKGPLPSWPRASLAHVC